MKRIHRSATLPFTYLRTQASLALLLLGFSFSPAHAEDFPGGEATSAAEFEKGFSADKGLTDAEKSGADSDRLKIGGVMASDFYLMSVDGPGAREYILNPNTLWVYFDARLRNDIRAYIKLRGVFDPTITSKSTSPFGSSLIPANASDVEEMKLNFNAQKKVYFTAGKQKIRWGTGKFWNPTDFLNQNRRNLLYSDDRRSGVSMLKTHVPVGGANLYLLNVMTGADRLAHIGNAVRTEIPLGASETALTLSKQPDQKATWGLDVSAAVWDFDVYGEAAYSNGSNRTFYRATGPYTKNDATVNTTLGVNYDVKYSDNDTVSFAVEYFHNAEGYAKSDYAWGFAGGGYVPYYFAKDYAMGMIYLPNPGSLQHTTFMLLELLNLTDSTTVTRLNVNVVVMQDLQFDFAVGAHFGDAAGEFRLGHQRFDFMTRAKVEF